MSSRLKYYDTHTLYVTSGVAREDQLHKSLRNAIEEGQERLYNEDLEDFIFDVNNNNEDGKNVSKDLPNDLTLTEKNQILSDRLTEAGYEPPEKRDLKSCKIKVNLIVNKNGDYYGFGYIHVSREDVYWMLLGKNPDGSDRVLEYLDPDWQPPLPKPVLTEEEEQEKYSNMKWYEIAEEEDKYVHPTIRQILEPLMPVPGYEYDEVQYRHHQEVAKKDGKDPSKVPKTGYFEFSRAYARDVESGKMPHVLCARQVPEWIPPIAFKQIFKDYASDSTTEILIEKLDGSDCYSDSEPDEEVPTELYDTYPMINLIDGKKDGGRVVFVSFEASTKDAIFALLMTRKVHIVHPRNPSLRCTLIFDHAYEKGRPDRIDRPKIDRPKNDWSKNDRPKNDRPKNDRPKNDRPKNDRPKNDSPKNDRHKNDRTRQERPVQSDAERNNRFDNIRNRTVQPQSVQNQPDQSQSPPTRREDNKKSSKNNQNHARDDIDISKYNYTKKK